MHPVFRAGVGSALCTPSFHLDPLRRRLRKRLAGAFLLVIPLGIAGCDSPTGSEGWVDVAIVTTDPITLAHDRGPDGNWLIGCKVGLSISVAASDPRATITWTDGRLIWIPQSTNLPAQTDILGGGEAAQFWRFERLLAGETIQGGYHFTAPETFRLEMAFGWRSDRPSGAGEASHTLACEPPAPPVAGTWTLRSINGRSLPAPSGTWSQIHSTTFTFYPNLTYEYSSRVGHTYYEDYTSEIDRYEIPAPDVIDLPWISQGVFGGHVSRSDDELVFVERHCCGGTDFTWRFGRL